MDFTAIYGDDFPLMGNVMSSKAYSEDNTPPHTESFEALSSTQGEADSVMEDSVRIMEEKDLGGEPGQENLVRVLLEPHEGQETVGCTYNIQPKQMVLGYIHNGTCLFTLITYTSIGSSSSWKGFCGSYICSNQ